MPFFRLLAIRRVSWNQNVNFSYFLFFIEEGNKDVYRLLNVFYPLETEAAENILTSEAVLRNQIILHRIRFSKFRIRILLESDRPNIEKISYFFW